MVDAASNRLQAVLAAAKERGLLPPAAGMPEQDVRPWPVLLLIALGAWLAAIPFIVIVGTLLGDFVSHGLGTYVIGVLLLTAALVVLRSPRLPVFLEQLAVPALLVGGAALAFGLLRDVPLRAACGVLCVVALGLALLVPAAWLRNLLGALAAALAVAMLMPHTEGTFAWRNPLWLALHVALVAGLCALLLHERALASARNARTGAAVESITGGWVAALLVGLAWWSGMTFLAGTVVGLGGGGELLHAGATDSLAPGLVSVVLVIAACVLLAERWPAVRGAGAPPSVLPAWVLSFAVAAVLAALAWFMPALGATLLALAGLATTQRWRLAGLAALVAVWIVGGFYYQLAWPLATKALVLVAAGAILGAAAWLAARQPATMRGAAPTFERKPAWWLAGAALATLLVANFGIWQKESLIARGDKLYVALAPVDPRSLMQGDYMRLNFALPQASTLQGWQDGARRPFVIAHRDARGVAQFLRVADAAAPLAPGELRIELAPKEGRWIFVTDAWFFREGDAARWGKARFGEFRVDGNGRALLVGLADDKLQAITP